MHRYDKELLTSSFVDMALITSAVNDAIDRFAKGGYVDGDEWPSRWKELKAYLAASKDRYHQAHISGVEVNVGSIAGRILVTFQKEVHNGTAQVTVIGGEDEPDRGCGLQSIAATTNEVLSMIDSVIVSWDMKKFKASSTVSI